VASKKRYFPHPFDARLIEPAADTH
jgi:hypothetical protein